jgi:hypothetical protein
MRSRNTKGSGIGLTFRAKFQNTIVCNEQESEHQTQAITTNDTTTR